MITTYKVKIIKLSLVIFIVSLLSVTQDSFAQNRLKILFPKPSPTQIAKEVQDEIWKSVSNGSTTAAKPRITRESRLKGPKPSRGTLSGKENIEISIQREMQNRDYRRAVRWMKQDMKAGKAKGFKPTKSQQSILQQKLYLLSHPEHKTPTIQRVFKPN